MNGSFVVRSVFEVNSEWPDPRSRSELDVGFDDPATECRRPTCSSHHPAGSGTFCFEELVPGLEFGFSVRLDLVRAVFAGLPIVQLEFQTRVPWVLAEAEPDAE